ncbi:MAG TPA: GTPase, partial [Rhodocyclaceae bacterium]|nr:GTPase [Rhodocyclaceae bacterium]
MLAEHFSAYTQWRGEVASGITDLRKWLQQNEVGDAQSDLRLQYLLDRLREGKLIVAFVAEFSRGKSELINAVF